MRSVLPNSSCCFGFCRVIRLCAALCFFCAALFLAAGQAAAEPVARNTAYHAARTELPGFFPGQWEPADEIILHDINENIVAYAFVFIRNGKTAAANNTSYKKPADFVEAQRAELTQAGKQINGNNPELYGEDRYATVFISADDTEPPVLRCFLGLPPQLVKAEKARTMSKEHAGGEWRIRTFLMQGLFDESFVLESTANPENLLLADTRVNQIMTTAEATTRAAGMKESNVEDSAKASLCKKAWQQYKTAAKIHNAPLMESDN